MTIDDKFTALRSSLAIHCIRHWWRFEKATPIIDTMNGFQGALNFKRENTQTHLVVLITLRMGV